MMEFECPECGRGLTGGDETGVSITGPHGFYDYDTPPASECRFRYCFHCGTKIPERDSLEKLRDDFSSALNECDRYVDEEFQEKYQRIFERLTALIEGGA